MTGFVVHIVPSTEICKWQISLSERSGICLLSKMSVSNKFSLVLTNMQRFFDRLFELDPELLALFSYNTNCGVAPECLSSPEFLDHVTKVSPRSIWLGFTEHNGLDLKNAYLQDQGLKPTSKFHHPELSTPQQ